MDDQFALRDVTFDILLVLAVAIVARFIWVFPATYLPRWLSPALARKDPSPPWRWAFLLGFVGVRGVVSLAAALGIPLSTATGAPFPYRDLILFITFGVIVVTLVGQGLMLPAIVRWLGLASASSLERQREHEAEHAARRDALEVAQSRLAELAAASEIPDGIVVSSRASRIPVEPLTKNSARRNRSASFSTSRCRHQNGFDLCRAKVHLPAAAGRPDNR